MKSEKQPFERASLGPQERGSERGGWKKRVVSAVPQAVEWVAFGLTVLGWIALIKIAGAEEPVSDALARWLTLPFLVPALALWLLALLRMWAEANIEAEKAQRRAKDARR